LLHLVLPTYSLVPFVVAARHLNIA